MGSSSKRTSSKKSSSKRTNRTNSYSTEPTSKRSGTGPLASFLGTMSRTSAALLSGTPLTQTQTRGLFGSSPSTTKSSTSSYKSSSSAKVLVKQEIDNSEMRKRIKHPKRAMKAADFGEYYDASNVERATVVKNKNVDLQELSEQQKSKTFGNHYPAGSTPTKAKGNPKDRVDHVMLAPAAKPKSDLLSELQKQGKTPNMSYQDTSHGRNFNLDTHTLGEVSTFLLDNDEHHGTFEQNQTLVYTSNGLKVPEGGEKLSSSRGCSNGKYVYKSPRNTSNGSSPAVSPHASDSDNDDTLLSQVKDFVTGNHSPQKFTDVHDTIVTDDESDDDLQFY